MEPPFTLFLNREGRAITPQAGDHDIAAFLGESNGDGTTDPSLPRRTGDLRDFAFETPHERDVSE